MSFEIFSKKKKNYKEKSILTTKRKGKKKLHRKTVYVGWNVSYIVQTNLLEFKYFLFEFSYSYCFLPFPKSFLFYVCFPYFSIVKESGKRKMRLVNSTLIPKHSSLFVSFVYLLIQYLLVKYFINQLQFIDGIHMSEKACKFDKLINWHSEWYEADISNLTHN